MQCRGTAPTRVGFPVSGIRAYPDARERSRCDDRAMSRHRQLSLFPFDDRAHAGKILAGELLPKLEKDAVVIGLARGGIVVAAAVARALDLPLETVAVRKIRHPLQPEYALGAVGPGGPPYVRARDGLTHEQLMIAVASAQRQALALDRSLHGDRPQRSLAGRTVVLIDDGLATGATMIAAARWARGLRARRVVAATAVGARDTVELVRQEVDEVVCPYALADLGAVGLWYADFSAVDDDEVDELLRGSRQLTASPV
jgi:putative phosphoribosyl transferase